MFIGELAVVKSVTFIVDCSHPSHCMCDLCLSEEEKNPNIKYEYEITSNNLVVKDSDNIYAFQILILSYLSFFFKN